MRLRSLVAAAMICLSASGASAQTMVTAEEWTTYAERFLDPSGRIVDDGNGNISHSEGQGYGLLLAYLAGNRGDFARIWSFTRSELLVRNDALAAWKWNPDTTPHVTDVNNASDGDLLIAYALGLAGEGWGEAAFTQQATRIAGALASTSVYRLKGRVLLRPGVQGFKEDQADGPVVNPSYWVFEAFPVLARLDPAGPWLELAASGEQLVRESSLGAADLPPDWVSLQRRPRPAEGFPPVFGYNALRIPLYLARAGLGEEDGLLARLAQAMAGSDGGVRLVDLARNEQTEELMDPGYRIIPALAACVAEGTAIDGELMRFEPTLYYPSTLHLLALAHLREARPQCS